MIEGGYVEVKGIVYAVKGLCEYDEGVAVVPKYLKTGCRKVTDLSTYCYRTTYISKIGRYACIVPLQEIEIYYDPMEFSDKRVPIKVREFINLLDKHVDGEVGLTGSYLLGCNRIDSDIDVVIYTYNPSQAHRFFETLKEKKIINQCYSKRIENYYEKIFKDKSMSLQTYLKTSKKILEGCFGDQYYSVKIIDLTMIQDICSTRFYFVENKSMIGTLVPVKSYTIPAFYRIIEKKTNEEFHLLTWRIRFTELRRGIYSISGGIFIDSNGVRWIIPDDGQIELLS